MFLGKTPRNQEVDSRYTARRTSMSGIQENADTFEGNTRRFQNRTVDDESDSFASTLQEHAENGDTEVQRQHLLTSSFSNAHVNDTYPSAHGNEGTATFVSSHESFAGTVGTCPTTLGHSRLPFLSPTSVLSFESLSSYDSTESSSSTRTIVSDFDIVDHICLSKISPHLNKGDFFNEK